MSESTLPSGIREDETGTRFIGGTVRSDGTVRKVYRVRPGYVPQEDVQKYVAPKRSRVPPAEGSDSRVVASSSSSPHLRTINGILAGGSSGRLSHRAKALAGQKNKTSVTNNNNNTEDEILPPSQKPSSSKPVDAMMADALSGLDINGKDKKKSLTPPESHNDPNRVTKPDSDHKLDSKPSTISVEKDVLEPSSKPGSIETQSSQATSNNDTKPTLGKYVPPWKRAK